MTRASTGYVKTGAAVVLLLAVALAAGLCRKTLVLEIDNPRISREVAEGDLLVRTYRNSMYGAMAREKFRIEGGRLRLFQVESDSEAVLDYLGIEKRGEFNVDRYFTEFSIPAASVGEHALRLGAEEIDLGTGQGRDGRVRVRLTEATWWSRLTGAIRRGFCGEER